VSDEVPNAMTQYLDEIETSAKRTGVGATIEVIAYAGHARIKKWRPRELPTQPAGPCKPQASPKRWSPR